MVSIGDRIMKKSTVYINGEQLDINPAEISFYTPTRIVKYNLINQGEVEDLKGINLEKIELNGILPSPTIGRNEEQRSAQEYIDQWNEYAEKGQPIRFIYIGQNWDINMLCSIQSLQWHEIGGCFDIDYTLTLHRWKSIQVKQGTWQRDGRASRETDKTQTSNGKTYTVKQGDTLSHIAKCLLGDSSRWREIYAQNQDTIKNANKIYVGQVILLPDDATGTVSQRSQGTTKSKQSSTKKTTKSKQSTTKKSTSKTNQTASTTIPKVDSNASKSTYKSASEIFDQYKRKR